MPPRSATAPIPEGIVHEGANHVVLSPPTSSRRSPIYTSSIGARRRSRVAAQVSHSTTPRNCRLTTGKRVSSVGRFTRIRWRTARLVGCAHTRRERNGFRWSMATIGSATFSSATGGFPRSWIGDSRIADLALNHDDGAATRASISNRKGWQRAQAILEQKR
jgi:hypothetical protein